MYELFYEINNKKGLQSVAEERAQDIQWQMKY